MMIAAPDFMSTWTQEEEENEDRIGIEVYTATRVMMVMHRGFSEGRYYTNDA